MKPDVIWQTLELVMRACPAFTEEIARMVEVEVRAEWGGQRPDIPKTAHRARGRGPGRNAIPPETAHAVIRDVLSEPQTSTEELTRRHGVSRASLYRLLKRDVPRR